MASSGNFGTWNPLADYSSGTTFSNGNCTTAISQQNQYRACLGPAIPDSGKWYIEFFIDNQSAGFPSDIGVLDGTINSNLNSGSYLSNAGSFHIEPMTGNLFSESTSGTSYTGNSGSPSSIGNSDAKVAIAIDRDANKLWFAVNNTWINVGSGVGDPANGNNPAVSSLEQNLSISHGIRQATGTSKVVINCGQDSTFGGLETAGGNADGNGFGDFFYSPPTGFLALCSGNLPISADIDPAQTDDDFPSKQFGVVTYTGNGTARSFTGLGFQPDMLWIKMRNSGDHGKITDSVRGVQKALISNTTGAETTDTNGVTAFGTDGFSIGSGNQYNLNEYNFVAWCWKGNGGTTASNSNGSITATVQANTAAGFSIATYTSPGSGTNHTVGHGLSDVDFIITKDRDSTFNWYCFHKSVPDKTYRLNSGSEHSYSNWSMGSTTWGSEDGYTHNSTDKFVAYCWQNVEGMQKFGSYIGNGNSDGPFVYLGFRPRLLVLKRTTSSGYWNVFDSARSTSNPVNKYLSWNSTDAEADGADVDFLSNGFKVRSTASGVNTSGTTYLYMAWADVPFKYNNTF
jgi:hypothetical protein